MNYLLEFEIPCPTPKDFPRTLNSSLNEQKYFIWERSKWRRKMKSYIYRVPEVPLVKAKLTLTKCSLRRPDFDNLVMSWKFIIDPLVTFKVLSDDSFKVVGIPEYIWEPAKKGNYRLKVKVEGL